MRPTSDMVREALFQILTVRMERSWEECRVLDLFAGTGALGLEALSRGAREVVFVDNSPEALRLVRKNLDALGFPEKCRVVKADILRPDKRFLRLLENDSFDLVLADPPYSKGLGERALVLVDQTMALAPGGWMVVEEQKGVDMNSLNGLTLELDHLRCYGQTCLWFFRKST